VRQVDNCAVHAIRVAVRLALLEMNDDMCEGDKEHFW
jgi:hypothetical protein